MSSALQKSKNSLQRKQFWAATDFCVTGFETTDPLPERMWMQDPGLLEHTIFHYLLGKISAVIYI